MSHVPDAMFGCARTWGEPLAWHDARLHVCNRDEAHEGRHVCKCGAWVSRPTEDDDG